MSFLDAREHGSKTGSGFLSDSQMVRALSAFMQPQSLPHPCAKRRACAPILDAFKAERAFPIEYMLALPW